MEVMGRYVGWIALHSGLAGRADAILIPEIAYEIDKVAAHLRRKHREGKPYSIVVVAEGAKPLGGDVTVRSREAGDRPTRRHRRDRRRGTSGTHWQGEPVRGSGSPIAWRIAYAD